MPTKVGYDLFGEENLVFGYDLADVSNSYKGEPTVNIAADLGLTDLGAGLSYLGIEDGWKKYSMSATWSGGGYPYSMALNGVSFTGGQPYSVVATLKTNVEHKFNYFCTDGISYVNQPKDYEGTLSATVNPDRSRTVSRVNFAYTSTTGQLGYLYTNPINGIVFNPDTDFVWVKEYQAEQKTHPTPFVNGTRSATQGLLDLTGNRNIDLSAVSFTSDAQMVFDGTDDYINLGPSANWRLGQNGTIEVVVRREGAITANHRLWCVFNNSSHLDAYLDAATGGLYLHGGLVGTNTQIPLNQYLHIIVRYDGSNITIWYNGVSQPLTGTTSGYQINGTSYSDLFIGRYVSDSGYRWNGSFPIFKIYSRALSDSEIVSNYLGVKNRFNI